MNSILPCPLLFFSLVIQVSAQTSEPVVNYDEAKVGSFTLPDPLQTKAGQRVANQTDWLNRRQELLNLFADHVYGRTPTTKVRLRFQVVQTDGNALGGLAVRKQISIFFTDYPQLAPIELLIYLPKEAKKPVTVFLGLNFCGNHCVTAETDIPLSNRWVATAADNHATEKTRAMQARRWPLQTILKRGYGVATAYYGDIEPDHPQGWRSGIRSVLGDTTRYGDSRYGDSRAGNWGAIGAWAWGMSRILDYLQTEPIVDSQRIISMGHSRIGKAALWAAAQDNRFAAVISNESGEGGAALARRWFGETVERLNSSFPHWFCGRYKTYDQRVTDLPVDQHELLALAAPRPLYVASAEGDQWSDPKGEFLSAVQIEPVYKLLGKTGLGTAMFPAVNQPVGQTVRYHNRSGQHDVTNYDWEQYLRFADELVR